MAFYPENIDSEPKALAQWGCYKLEMVDGKKTKVPYSPANGQKASSTDPITWASFNVALAAYLDLEIYDGICFFVTEESGIVFIDLDNCIEDGAIMQWALEIVENFNSYTERSQSGKGLHILINGKKLGKRCSTAKYPHKVEIYDHARQCCLTGEVIENGHTTIECRQEALDALYKEIFGDAQQETTRTPQKPGRELPDDALIQKALQSKNGTQFKALWEGSTVAYNGDDSAADLALMNHLKFWTGGNTPQMERLFSSSGLGQRAKWTDRPEYREMTIQKALSAAGDFYEPSMTRTRADWIETDTGDYVSNAVDDQNPGAITEEELEAYSLPEGPKFECNLPANHFIQRFMAYGSDISDAYIEYWFAGGLFALAVVADKKIKLVLRQGTQYPNLYVSINGKSSLARKSTVVDKTEAMICQVLTHIMRALVPTEFSPEAFTEHLSDHNHAPWIRDEAAGVLSLMKKDYMRGFKDSLMQLFDCKPFYRKLRTSQRKGTKTEFRVDDPYLNLLWATTDASLGANTEQNDTLSGFLARFLFFFPTGKKPNWLPLEEGTALNSIFEEAVRLQLSGIADKIRDLPECTAMHFSPEAARYYTEWQRVREEEWTASNDGNAMQIYSRLAPTVVKFGMLFELGSTDFDVSRPIRLEFIEEACRLVDSYFMPTARAVYDLVGVNAEKNVIDRITAYLKKHNGKASKKEIMRDVKIKSADFRDYLETMVESGMVETKTVNRGGKGRDTLYVFLLDQPKVGKVAKVAKIAKVAKVEEIPLEKVEGKKSTLATQATMATQATIATQEKCVDAGEDDNPSPTFGKIDRPTPERERFNANVQTRSRNTCRLCGQHFEIPLQMGCQGGFMCSKCHREGAPSAPVQADAQQTLSEVASAN